MDEFVLNNNLKVCVKRNKNTPRIALAFNFSIEKEENKIGEYVLMNNLLTKGTKNYSSEELAKILDENAIDLSAEMKYDYLRFRVVTLNEDFEYALSILADIMKNPTFNDFEKEKGKLKGEFLAELDSAKVKIYDLFTKTMYKNHFYGHSLSSILENIDKVQKDDVKSAYKNILENSYKTVCIVGDISTEEAKELLSKYFIDIPTFEKRQNKLPLPEKITQEIVEIKKEDAQQAQIIQGWKVAPFGTEDYAKLMLLNVILGASGLSSRLFLELREKKGLAYTVRTSYDAQMESSVFSIYIGTEPSNIKTSIEGFKLEIEKIKNELISEEELKSAKNNIIGKQQFITETNAQQACSMAYHSVLNKDFNYKQELISKLRNITPQELQECARKYFTEDYVLAILKP